MQGHDDHKECTPVPIIIGSYRETTTQSAKKCVVRLEALSPYLLISHLLYKFCHKPSPTRLMRSTYAPSAVAVEIFVEQYVVMEVRILLKLAVMTIHGTVSIAIFSKDVNHSR